MKGNRVTMKDNKAWVGLLVLGAVVLFGGALFLIGDQNKAFSRRTDFYAEFTDLSGIAKGAKVRVSGMDAGQVADIIVPSSPSQKFRVKVTIENKLRGLVRDDSVASVETAGVIGDQFLLIKVGSDSSPEAQPGATLKSKEPFDLGKMLDRANGMLNQVGGILTKVDGTVTDLHGKMDGALDAVTTTVNNTNGVVTDIRRGKGTAGVLLENPKTAADVQQVVANTKQATANLTQASVQVNAMLDDVQKRQLVAKVDDTLNSAKSAGQQLNEASQQLNGTLKTALAQDQYGQDAGANLQQTLSNVNAATGNLADDTEALKHEFFFKGFFKKRGFDNLDQISVARYRSGEQFKKLSQDRHWIDAGDLFVTQPDGTETLSAAGRAHVDEAVSQIADLYDSPMIVEGYAQAPSAGEQLVRSRQRAMLVRAYIQVRYRLAPKQSGVVGLGVQPPQAANKPTWNGVCLVVLSERK